MHQSNDRLIDLQGAEMPALPPVIELTSDVGRFRSRLLAVQDDRSVVASQYRDELVRTADGWRISRRVVTYTRRGRSVR
jgi:hypothetical protein